MRFWLARHTSACGRKSLPGSISCMPSTRRRASRAADTVRGLEAWPTCAARFAAGINMRFLYDSSRRLFGVGYAVGGPVEFRATTICWPANAGSPAWSRSPKATCRWSIGIALGRPRVSLPGGAVLLSWSGTMFEYLMPLLFTRTFTNSLLDHACREAVRQQIEYGSEKDVPWGISESAYSALDANQIYQYRAFGVPAWR